LKHYKKFFSALNEVHQFLSQRRTINSSLSLSSLTQSGLTSQPGKSNKHSENVLTF